MRELKNTDFCLKSSKKQTKVVKRPLCNASYIKNRDFVFFAQSASSSLVSGKRENIRPRQNLAFVRNFMAAILVGLPP